MHDFVETMDQKTDLTKLWRTIKGIDGRAKREAENEAITINGISFSSSKRLATKFNQQFNTSKLGRHTSSRETRVVTRKTKRKPLEMVRTFTTDLVMKAIKSCRNSKALAPTNSASSTWSISDLERLNTSQPSSTSRPQPVRFRIYGSHH